MVETILPQAQEGGRHKRPLWWVHSVGRRGHIQLTPPPNATTHPSNRPPANTAAVQLEGGGCLGGWGMLKEDPCDARASYLTYVYFTPPIPGRTASGREVYREIEPGCQVVIGVSDTNW